MKRNFRFAFNKLKSLGVPVFERDDMEGRFLIRAEGPDWAYRVKPESASILSQYGLFATWIYPGEFGVYSA